MFDISFAELIVISIVALIVIGPERLPSVARTLGHLLGRARRYVERVKHDLHEEMELDQLRKLRDSMHETVGSFEKTIHKEMNEIHKSADIQSAIAEKDPSASEAEKPSTSAEQVHSLSHPTESQPSNDNIHGSDRSDRTQ
jgi:sec-independent protein translocase protein TatB